MLSRMIDRESSPLKLIIRFIPSPLSSGIFDMADLERRYNTLNEIVQKTTIRYVCPKCLRGFSRPTLLYQHFREDESHNALSMRRENFKRFLSSYQESLGCKIPAKELPPDAECFRIQYVIDHYKRDQNLTNSLPTPGPNNLYAGKAILWCSKLR